ncbi:hypothetical protein KFL_002940130 [Klebsormidium nitens]|uniref:Replication origin-binding protein domain-containing protein n=1 Tax=Klebsormidium nitens TaxID=105231 RepID=A0A1Y1ICS6_KLENI|nr:hypothetical protein KFL_002940130 [Klebsormidium nitens]|eukprot:GAQ86527.1 hypothetical protein KFL_002940130 [Klebsormidium nitens]
MAGGRPHGRSKSDHRVCQAARYAHAAAYRERISISAEQQEARIAAVNAECDVQDAPRKRRGQNSRGLKKEACAARGSAHGRFCKASGSAKKKANQRLGKTLGKAAERDPHTLHCHECAATAEFGHRGSKEGGNVKYLCRGHVHSTGCFRITRDRAAWAQNRVEWRLKVEAARLEAELRQMGGASSTAEQHRCQDCYESACKGSWENAAYWDSTPKSRSLIAKLLTIGGVESNPGPAPDEVTGVRGENLPRGVSSGRPLIPLPSLEEVYQPPSQGQPNVERIYAPALADWKKKGGLSEQISGANERGQGREGAANRAPSDENILEVAGTDSRIREQILPCRPEERVDTPPASATIADFDTPEEVPIGQLLSGTEGGLAKGSEAAQTPKVCAFLWPTAAPQTETEPATLLPLQERQTTTAGARAEIESVESEEVELAEFLRWRKAKAAKGREAAAEATQSPASAASGPGRVAGLKRSSNLRSPVVNSRAGARRRGMPPTSTAAAEQAEEATPSDEELEDAGEDIQETSEESESDDSEELSDMDASVQSGDDDPNTHRALDQTLGKEKLPRSVDDALAGMRLETERMRRQEEASGSDQLHQSAASDFRKRGAERGLPQGFSAVPEPEIRSEPLTGNEVFKKDGFRVLRVHEFGTNCFHQAGKNLSRFPGPKHFMQQEAALLNHEVQVALHKWSGMRTEAGVPIGWRSFASYPDWETACRNLDGHRSVFEVIQNGQPCKPYLDLDGKDGLPFRRKSKQADAALAKTGDSAAVSEAGPSSGAREEARGAAEHRETSEGRYTLEEVMEIIQEWATIVFKECYALDLEPSSFVWMESGGQAKVSLHLTINQLLPRQLVFASNFESGAAHFATRLKRRLQPWYPTVAPLIDLNVYSKDREWRTPGSAKIEKPESVLQFVNLGHTWKDALVTWLEPLEAREEIKVPFQLPGNLHRKYKTPQQMTHEGTTRTPKNEAFVRARMLELLRERLHPTAYVEGPDRFNYFDRSEPCYTGRIHENHQNLTCHLTPKGKIYALCFSTNSEGGESDLPCRAKAFYLGDLFEDDINYESGAVRVDMQYLQRDPAASSPELLARVAHGQEPTTDVLKLNTVADQWLAGAFQLLAFRSGVGTGKTEFCKSILEEIRHLLQADGRLVTKLMITYCIAQAKDLKQRFPDSANYLDLKADYKDELFPDPDCPNNFLTALQNRSVFPWVVVQVDSLLNLRPHGVGEVAPFDLVILDEAASILAHLSSATLRCGLETGELFLEIVQKAKRVLAMDDGYGQREHDFFQLAKVPGKLVINTRRAKVPLTFRVCQEEALWLDRIVRDLSSGKNVVVVSMSARVLDRIRDRVLSGGGRHSLGLEEGDILMHRAMSGGDNTALLENVNVNWKVRLLMYSPSVEAGVNFDEEWFHSKYLYMCKQSTTARAVWQASLRVRRTESPLVYCFVQQGISVRLDCAPEVPSADLDIELETAGTSSPEPEPSVQDADEDVTSEVQQDDAVERLDEQVADGSPLKAPHRAERASMPPSDSDCKKGKAKGGQPGVFLPPRRVTTAETLQFLQACTSRAAAAWSRVRSRAENATGAVQLIEDGPLFRTLGHTEAERRNSDARLLQEFQAQVAKAGHVVEVEPYVEPTKQSKRRGGLTQEAYDIIEAKTIGAVEYAELASLRDVKRDRGTQHNEVAKYEACAFYGLKDLDDSFFLKTQAAYKSPFSEPLANLLKVLLPAPAQTLDQKAMGPKSFEILRVEYAKELISALGLAHPFDKGYTPTLLAGGLRERLMKTGIFEGRAKFAADSSSLASRTPSELFRFKLPRPKEGQVHLLPGQIKKAVNVVLGWMGLKLGKLVEVSRGARRGKGKNYGSSAGLNDYKLSLAEKSILRMAKLTKLRFREVPEFWKCRMELLPAVREFLDVVDASEFDHLLRRSSGAPLLAELGPPEIETVVEPCIIAPPRST